MGEVVAVFFPHPVKQQKFMCRTEHQRWQKKRTYKRRKQKQRHKPLTKRESKHDILQLKGRLERTVFGVQTKRCTHKKLLCHQRGSNTHCPMKEGGEFNETCERFLSLDPDSPVPLSAEQKRGVVLESCGSNGKHSAPIFAWTLVAYSGRIFFATQISRDYSIRAQCHLLWTDADREKRMSPHVKQCTALE